MWCTHKLLVYTIERTTQIYWIIDICEVGKIILDKLFKSITIENILTEYFKIFSLIISLYDVM